MSSDVKIPEWAEREAAELWASLGFVNDRLNHRPTIARALLAAERRGLEKAAVVAEGLYLQETENHGDLYDGDVAAAIRSLGEKT